MDSSESRHPAPSPSGLGAGIREREDWHVHTHLSDGLRSPAEMVREAASLGLSRIAITDHDGIDAHLDPSLKEIARAEKIALVPGVEIDCTLGDLHVEILGFEFAPEAGPLAARLATIQAARVERIRILTERLIERGEPLDSEHVLPPGTKAPLKVHLYRALLQAGRPLPGGYAEFKALIASLGPVASIPVPTAAEAAAWISKAGGYALLAHPLYYLRAYPAPRLAAAVRAAGCVGMEFLYPYDFAADGIPTAQARAGLNDLRAAARAEFSGSPHFSAGTDVHDPAEWKARLLCVQRWRREFPRSASPC